MNLTELRENLVDFIEMECPFLDEIKDCAVSLDDMIDHIIYEGIKYAYDYYAERKSIRQHLKDNNMDDDSERRKFSRALQYAQYYRDLQYEQVVRDHHIGIDELHGKDMKEFDTRMEGHEINAMNFVELCNMRDIPLLNKIIGKQIQSSKKVSNPIFIELMDQYDAYIDELKAGMDTDESVIYNTELFFTLEWKYNVDLVYNIALEAEKHGFPEITVDNTRWLCGTVQIPGSTWYPYVAGVESRMIMHRHKYLPFMFDMENEDEIAERDAKNAALYHLKSFIATFGSRKTITELVHTTDMSDRASFIRNRYWIWKHHVKKEWTRERIKYARTVFKLIYQDIAPPKIK